MKRIACSLHRYVKNLDPGNPLKDATHSSQLEKIPGFLPFTTACQYLMFSIFEHELPFTTACQYLTLSMFEINYLTIYNIRRQWLKNTSLNKNGSCVALYRDGTGSMRFEMRWPIGALENGMGPDTFSGHLGLPFVI
jgi:hypothetical protein